MKVAEYQKGMHVTKHANFPCKKRHGVTLSDAPFTTVRARGAFCKVKWDDSSVIDEVALPILSVLAVPIAA